MEETYAAQHLLIIKNVEMEIVLKEFPFLSVNFYFLRHVQKLMGFDVLDRLTKSIEEKAPEVIMCINNSQSSDVNKLEFLEVLCNYFQEDKKQFLMIVEVGIIFIL